MKLLKNPTNFTLIIYISTLLAHFYIAKTTAFESMIYASMTTIIYLLLNIVNKLK